VNFAVTDGSVFNLFAGNNSNNAGYFATGVTFTLTANFSDGSTSVVTTTITSSQSLAATRGSSARQLQNTARR
jgi:hypothetical protein